MHALYINCITTTGIEVSSDCLYEFKKKNIIIQIVY